MKKAFVVALSFLFLFNQVLFAMPGMGEIGREVVLTGISLQGNKVSFLYSKGEPFSGKKLNRLVGYFAVAMAVPQKGLWANLSPNIKENQIVSRDLLFTDYGRVLIESDLLLKNDAIEVIDKCLAQNDMDEEFLDGSRFRFWIVPGDVSFVEDGDNIFISKASLKVRVDADNKVLKDFLLKDAVPILTAKVNSSPRYMKLRQVFYATLLAVWLKDHPSKAGVWQGIKDKGVYSGLFSREPWSKRFLLDLYLRMYFPGDPANDIVSGGIEFDDISYETKHGKGPASDKFDVKAGKPISESPRGKTGYNIGKAKVNTLSSNKLQVSYNDKSTEVFANRVDHLNGHPLKDFLDILRQSANGAPKILKLINKFNPDKVNVYLFDCPASFSFFAHGNKFGIYINRSLLAMPDKLLAVVILRELIQSYRDKGKVIVSLQGDKLSMSIDDEEVLSASVSPRKKEEPEGMDAGQLIRELFEAEENPLREYSRLITGFLHILQGKAGLHNEFLSYLVVSGIESAIPRLLGVLDPNIVSGRGREAFLLSSIEEMLLSGNESWIGSAVRYVQYLPEDQAKILLSKILTLGNNRDSLGLEVLIDKGPLYASMREEQATGRTGVVDNEDFFEYMVGDNLNGLRNSLSVALPNGLDDYFVDILLNILDNGNSSQYSFAVLLVNAIAPEISYKAIAKWFEEHIEEVRYNESNPYLNWFISFWSRMSVSEKRKKPVQGVMGWLINAVYGNRISKESAAKVLMELGWDEEKVLSLMRRSDGYSEYFLAALLSKVPISESLVLNMLLEKEKIPWLISTLVFGNYMDSIGNDEFVDFFSKLSEHKTALSLLSNNIINKLVVKLSDANISDEKRREAIASFLSKRIELVKISRNGRQSISLEKLKTAQNRDNLFLLINVARSFGLPAIGVLIEKLFSNGTLSQESRDLIDRALAEIIDRQFGINGDASLQSISKKVNASAHEVLKYVSENERGSVGEKFVSMVGDSIRLWYSNNIDNRMGASNSVYLPITDSSPFYSHDYQYDLEKVSFEPVSIGGYFFKVDSRIASQIGFEWLEEVMDGLAKQQISQGRGISPIKIVLAESSPFMGGNMQRDNLVVVNKMLLEDLADNGEDKDFARLAFSFLVFHELSHELSAGAVYDYFQAFWDARYIAQALSDGALSIEGFERFLKGRRVSIHKRFSSLLEFYYSRGVDREEFSAIERILSGNNEQEILDVFCGENPSNSAKEDLSKILSLWKSQDVSKIVKAMQLYDWAIANNLHIQGQKDLEKNTNMLFSYIKKNLPAEGLSEKGLNLVLSTHNALYKEEGITLKPTQPGGIVLDNISLQAVK